MGSIVAPFTITLGRVTMTNPFVFIGALSLLGTLSSTMVSETLNRPFQDEIEELRVQEDEIENESLV